MRLVLFIVLVIAFTYYDVTPTSAEQHANINPQVVFFGGKKRSGSFEHSVHKLSNYFFKTKST